MRRVEQSLMLFFSLPLAGCGLAELLDKEVIEPPTAINATVREPDTFQPAKDCGGNLSSEQRMYLELIHKMVEQKHYYGALANLDQLEKTAPLSPQTNYLRAEALRGASQLDEAEKPYLALLHSCMAGYGLHGLGLLASEKKQWPKAQGFLERASRERPVDADIHNDLGMVLMLSGQYQAARQEFFTAMELERNNHLAMENYIVLMLAEGQNQQALEFAEQRGFQKHDLENLLQRAQNLNKPQADQQTDQPSGE